MGKQKWREEASSSSTPVKRLRGPSESHLVDWLMKEVHWYQMSWTKARACAHAAVLDGLANEPSIGLAAAGPFGSYEGNAFRDSKKLASLEQASSKAHSIDSCIILRFHKSYSHETSRFLRDVTSMFTAI